jgi:TRAP-type transport system periplasmic protein
MQSRRTLVLALAIVAAAAWSGWSQSIKLTYANFPPATTFPCVQMERWAQEVEKRTNGKVKVQTFPGGTLLAAKNMIDGVISGVADIGCFSPSYQPGRFPVSEAVDLPFSFPNAKVASLAYLDLVHKYNPKELDKVKVITLFTCSPANLMTKTPVRTLADMKGMELRVAGTGVDVVKALGGVPVAMPQSETPDAIQKGIVKGMVTSMEVLKDMSFAEYCRWATTLNTHVVSFGVVMNLSRWKALPADVQKVITDMEREQSLWTASYADDHVTDALAWSQKTYDHKVLTLPADDQARVKKVMEPLIDEYVRKTAAQGLPGADIVKDLRAFAAAHAAEYP